MYNQLDSKHQIRINTLNETTKKTAITNSGGVFSADTAYSARFFYCGQSRYIDITGYLDHTSTSNIYPTILQVMKNCILDVRALQLVIFKKPEIMVQYHLQDNTDQK